MKSLLISLATLFSVAAFATESSVISHVFSADAVKSVFNGSKILNISLDTVDNSSGSTSERVHSLTISTEKKNGSSTESCNRMIEVLEEDAELSEVSIDKAICQ